MDQSSSSKDGTISLKIFKNSTTLQKLVEIHSVSINHVEDAVCTPPGSIITQNGRYVYYFKMGNKWQDNHDGGGHNVEAHLMKFDLLEEREIPEPTHTYKLHYTDLDNPLYI